MPQDKLRIGYEADHLSLQGLDAFRLFYPASVFLDVGLELMGNRMIKSAEEIELIKNGARIADIGGYA